MCDLLTNRVQDYYATPYAAEIINSFTNLAFVYLAYRGIANCIRNGHDTVFLVGFVSYLVIGVGSFLFHATLKCRFFCPQNAVKHYFRGESKADFLAKMKCNFSMSCL
jgi:hypothetical protein